MKRLRIILGVAMFAGLASLPVAGRVFRGAAPPDGWLNTRGLPWSRAYRTTMDVNGRKTAVCVYSARYNEPVAEQLKAQFELQGARIDLRTAQGSAMGVASWDGGEARILVLSPDGRPNQTVFLFYPEARAARPPAFPVPEYPGGTVENAVSNEDSKTFCAMIETTDPAGEVLAFYAGSLSAEGWTPLLPFPPSGGGMALFRKQNRVCCVLAKARSGEETQVTVLVRNGKL